MAGLYPHQWDGGIPPNEATPDNPAMAFEPGPYTQPPDTTVLYYGNGCDIRIRAPVLNTVISEITAVLDFAGLAYHRADLTNLRQAIVRLIKSNGNQIIPGHEPGYPYIDQLEQLKKEVAVLKAEIAELKKVPA